MDSNFFASARKYRPTKFTEVVGQNHVVDTLKNAVLKQRLPQSFLFHGPRGVGKTSCARILAKVINCENLDTNGNTCEECNPCKAFNEKTSLNIFELDAASNNSVEDIRELIEQISIVPQTGKFKIYIIDEVHMLSSAAFNAFLKTLEEPPTYAVFILATTEKQKVLPTIISRCQVFDFHRISSTFITQVLLKVAKFEKVTFEEKALSLIAQKSEGSLRDALYIFDKLVGFSNGNLDYLSTVSNLHVLDNEFYFGLVRFFKENAKDKCLFATDEILSKGFELKYFIEGISKFFRQIIFYKITSSPNQQNIDKKFEEKMTEFCDDLSIDLLQQALKEVTDCELKLKTTNIPRIFVELSLLRLCDLLSLQNNSEIKSEIKTPLIQNTVKKSIETDYQRPIKKDTEPSSPKNEKTKKEPSVMKNKMDIPNLDDIKKKDIVEQTIPKSNEYRTKEIKDEVPFDTLLNEFYQSLKKENKEMLLSVLKTASLRFENPNTIYLFATSDNNYSTLDTNKELVSNYFSSKILEKIEVIIEMKKEEGNKREKLPFTAKEKMNYFSKQNTHFKTLVDELSLSIKY